MRTDLSIDFARVIGILLVVAGHARGPWPLEKAIYSFHMPLFFLLSGYLSNPTPLSQLITKKTKTLLVPYAMTVFASFACFGTEPWAQAETWWHLLRGLATGGSEDTLAFNSPLWFLPTLFTVFVIHTTAWRLSGNCLLTGLLAFLGVWIASAFDLPVMHLLRLDTALFSYPFFMLGVILGTFTKFRSGVDDRDTPQTRQAGIFLVVTATVWVFARILDHNAYYVLGHNKVDPLAFFYLNGISGALMAFFLARVLTTIQARISHPVFTLLRAWIPSLSTVSFGIYLLHKPLMLALASVLRDKVLSSIVTFTTLTFFGLCVPLLILRVLRWLSPAFHAALLGKRKPRRG